MVLDFRTFLFINHSKNFRYKSEENLVKSRLNSSVLFFSVHILLPSVIPSALEGTFRFKSSTKALSCFLYKLSQNTFIDLQDLSFICCKNDNIKSLSGNFLNYMLSTSFKY
jgi:hypothetical protein